MAPHVQLTTTTATREAALRLARTGVERRLAACGQVSGPVTSLYWWDGTLQSAEEWVCTFKTAQRHAEALAGALRAAHDYTTPEIVITPVVGGDPDYLAWIDAETEPPAR